MTLTPERAKEIWLARKPYQADIRELLTVEERRSVDELWATMPNWTRWIDAFFAILNNRVPVSTN